MDADGFVTVVDRIKELIITGGFNVYPSEVEEALRRVPGVRDAAVVGMPERAAARRWSPRWCSTRATASTRRRCGARCREHLAGYKVPRRVVVVDELPRSQIGKVLRREVRERLLADALNAVRLLAPVGCPEAGRPFVTLLNRPEAGSAMSEPMSLTAATVPPQRPADVQTTLLLSCLDAQRQHVLGILEGLDEDALRRPVLPSGWSCLGLVRHLALDCERFWFRCVVAAEPDAIAGLGDVGNAWQVDADVPAAAVLDLYRREIDRANAVITATPLDAAPAWWPDGLFGDWPAQQPARGHPAHDRRDGVPRRSPRRDAELTDGRTWLVLPT